MEKEEKLFSSQRGITLITLIITIIVLLILAGITISLVVGDNGVLNQAQKAKTRTDEESAKEEIYLEVSGSYDETGEINLATLNENLKRKGGVSFTNAEEITEDTEFVDLTDENQIEELPVTVKYKEVEIEIDGDYINNDENINIDKAVDKEEYGKYVNYPIDIDGDGNTKNDWVIFYRCEDNGEKHTFIRAADVVKASIPEMSGENGAITKCGAQHFNGWDDISFSWSDSGLSVCDEWKSGSFFNFIKSKYDNYAKYLDVTDRKEAEVVRRLVNTDNWTSFISGDAINLGEFAIGGPTIDLLISSYNATHDDKIELNSDSWSNGYLLNEDIYIYGLRLTCNQNDGKIFGVSEETCNIEDFYGYWIPCVTDYYNEDFDDYYMVTAWVYTDGLHGFNDCPCYLGSGPVGVCPIIKLRDGLDWNWVDNSDDSELGYYNID